ncbi:MAG TPA: ATP synthase F1 subunit delta [Ktedonobacteraceae bacterium]|nr:ATP synthase F1 subunit delta [Ktedonobacteraceae bacterium]
MLKGAIARRYAGAMFDLALRQNTLERTLDDVQGLGQLFSKHTLAYLLREPKVPLQRKEKALREALGTRVQPMSLNLALLVVQRGLVEVMPNIATELQQMVFDYKNQAVAEVTTAAPMDTNQEALVKQALERQTGKTILLQAKVNPAILGGVVARVGDQVIDGSVQQRLQVLKKQLINGLATSSLDELVPQG